MATGGITLIADSKRYYPEGESAAHVVGFTDVEDAGQEGVELAAEARLRGTPGQREVIRDRLGRVISEPSERVPPKNGETVQLTVDRRVQQLAYTQLKAAVAKITRKRAASWCSTRRTARFSRSRTGRRSIRTTARASPASSCATAP
jgi:cell division protein FtsI/penicillin-binding protein 2